MMVSRRTFLGGTLAFAGAAVASTGCKCACGCAGKPKVALQLYSVRGLTKTREGFAQTLKDVAAIGYKGVEFAGYGGYKAEELKKMLDDLGLGRAGTHLGFGSVSPANIAKTIDFNLGYGNRNLVVPWWNPPKDCKDPGGAWKKFAEDMAAAAETARKSGCTLAYHNHQHEFRNKFDGVSAWDIIYRNAPKSLNMQLDVGHVVSAGEDPVEVFKRYPGRSVTLHAKEVYGKGGATGVLGQCGTAKGVNWPELFVAAKADGVQWYVVECEAKPDTLDHVKASFKFLKDQGQC